MHQRRGLQCLARLLVRQFCSRQLAELLVNKRQQLLSSLLVASLDQTQNLCDLGHVADYSHGLDQILEQTKIAIGFIAAANPCLGLDLQSTIQNPISHSSSSSRSGCRGSSGSKKKSPSPSGTLSPPSVRARRWAAASTSSASGPRHFSTASRQAASLASGCLGSC